MRRGAWSLVTLLALEAALCAAVAGCGGGEPDPGPWEPVEPELLEDPRFGVFVPGRIDAVLGTPMVILVELAGNFRAEDVGPVRLDDGRELETSVYWIGVRPGEPGATWLAPAGEWTARTAEEVALGSAPSGEVGTWAILVDPPIDAVGQGLWIAGQRRVVNWLPDPAVLALRVSSRAWQSPLPPAMRGSERLRFRVEPERTSPLRRWRYRLMAGELSPIAERRVVELDGSVRRAGSGSPVEWRSGAMVSPVLEALASQQESKWAIGLARLDQADDEVAERVRQRLCAVVDFGAGEVAPVWPVGQEGLDRLLMDLLDQQLTARERARRARLWLDDQTTSLAWVVSDAPRDGGPGGGPRTVVAAANMGFASQLATVSNALAGETSDLSTLAPLTARAFEVSGASRDREGAVLTALVGETEYRLAAPWASVRAAPPGLRVDRFAADWTLSTMLAGAPAGAIGGEAWRTGALLYREPAGRWVLYVECASPRPDAVGERVRVTLGAEGSAGDMVIELGPGREAIVEPGGAAALGAGAPVQPEAEVSVFPGGWSARLVVPELAMEANGGLIRLGVERRDALDRRSAWPRAMLPWQGACARAGVDLTGWGGLGR